MILSKSKKTIQKEIYDIHSKRMFAVCLRYFHKEKAEKLLEDSFVRFFTNFQEYNYPDSFIRESIKSIIIDELVNYVVSNKLKLSTVSETKEINIYFDKHKPEEILEVFNTLNEPERFLYNFITFECFTFEKISDIFGCTPIEAELYYNSVANKIIGLLK